MKRSQEKASVLKRAQRLLQRGEPLPVDLIAKLLDHGIDVAALERKWAA